jgi:uncharacterized protein HemX
MNEDQLEAHEPEALERPEAVEEQDDEPGSGRSGSKILVIAVVVVAIAIAATGWMLGHPRAVPFTTTYQAVMLINGQVYFGRLEGYGTSNPVLTEVYYVQSTIDPQTRQQSNILTKRGKDWHGPDRMYINPQQIVIVEPVNPDSRVGELIKELKMQR